MLDEVFEFFEVSKFFEVFEKVPKEEHETFGPAATASSFPPIVIFFEPKVTLTLAVDETTFSWTFATLPKVRVIFGDATLDVPPYRSE